MSASSEKTDRPGLRPRPRSAWLLLLGALAPLAALALLYSADVPLGKPGKFIYRYSPIVSLRMLAVPAAVVIAAGFAAAVWFTTRPTPKRKTLGLLLGGTTLVALGAWTWRAPPDPVNQHVFNMESPSHDGAFVTEATLTDSLSAYFEAFPKRARKPPEQMRGTRVISNPPGTTALAYAARRAVEDWPAVREFFARPIDLDEPAFEAFRTRAAIGLAFAGLLLAMWLAAGPVWYATARLFLSPGAALVVALPCVATPATLLFAPGKDVAQLLTAGLPALCWFVAARRGSWIAGLLAGLFLTLSLTISLVHVWLAAIVVLATAWSVRRDPPARRRLLLRGLLPATVAAAITAVLLYAASGLNLPAVLAAAAEAQARVTRGPDAMPWLWQMLGVPLFLLFCGPALWTLVFWQADRASAAPADADARLGTALALLSAAVMVGTVGFTNIETPRLWIPFVPLVTLGLALRLTTFRNPGPAAALLATLAGLHVLVSAVHWALMDMREAEYRLLSERFFG